MNELTLRTKIGIGLFPVALIFAEVVLLAYDIMAVPELIVWLCFFGCFVGSITIMWLVILMCRDGQISTDKALEVWAVAIIILAVGFSVTCIPVANFVLTVARGLMK